MKKFLSLFIFFLGSLFAQDTFAYVQVSKTQACQLTDGAIGQNLVVAWPGKLAFNDSFIKSHDKLYYSVLLAPKGKYDINSNDENAASFSQYVSAIYVYSYDCKTGKIKKISRNNLHSVVPRPTSAHNISATMMRWQSGNLLALFIGVEGTDMGTDYLFQIDRGVIVDIGRLSSDTKLSGLREFSYESDFSVTISTYEYGNTNPTGRYSIDLLKRTITRIL